MIVLGGCQDVRVATRDAGAAALKQEMIRAIRDHYAYPVDVAALIDRAVPDILAALDPDSSLQEIEPSSLDFIRGFEREGSVSGLEMLADDIGYLRISFFGRRTLPDLAKALEGLRSHRCGGLILDLRDNPGGRLEDAVWLASLFLPAGVTLGQYRGRGDSETLYVSKGPGTRTESLIILINRRTASSAEFFAGLLRYHGRALLVGKRTAGKSTVQSAIPLDHRHLLFLTTGHYALPDGSSVPAAGLGPDHAAGRESEAVAKALSILSLSICAPSG